jgi:hypothetical protein
MSAGLRNAKLIAGLIAVLALVLFAESAAADPPEFQNVPGTVTVEATSSSGATATWSDPTATDGSPVSCVPGSGSSFPLGTTSVTCTATNPDTSETADVHFDVVVQDTTAPSVSVPGSASAEATGPGGASVAFSASATDAVDGSLGVSCSPSSGSTFALGTTTVTCSATDAHGNTGSASFGVTVSDTTDPSVTVPSDIVTTASGPGGAAVSYTVSASDTVDASPSISCTKASGSTFPVGQTTVTCTATDDSGNSASDSFKVTVTDGVAPVVTVPGAITREATGASGASVTFSASASDNVDGSVATSCAPASGSTFAIGTTTVSCTARDTGGNTGSSSFTVTVRDTTAPVVSVPANFVKEATSATGAPATFAASASDIVDGTVPVSCSPASGADFPLGATTVTCTATDSHSNTGTASFTVTVRDTTPPDIPVLADVTAEADGPSGAVVNYRVPTAVDLGEPVPTSCSPTAGTTFPLGATVVTCSAADAFGNRRTAAFTVRVVDTTKPSLNVPRATTVSANGATALAKTSPDVAAYLAAANARDLVDGAVPVTNNAPASFPVGTTTVTFTAKDRAGNVATAQSQLKVVPEAVTPVPIDTTPPADVGALKAKPGDGTMLLSWTPPGDADFDHVRILRSESESTATPVTVYEGAKRSFRDTGLKDGVELRYVVVAYDKTGNASRGLVIRATPKAVLLTAPKDGAVVVKPPLLKWRAAASATYYNVQLFRASTAARAMSDRGETKILSAWPNPPQLALKARWTYGGKPQQLAPGRYIWFVWPGLGARAANKYGALLGQSGFTVKAAPKPVKKPTAKKKPTKKKKAPKKKR